MSVQEHRCLFNYGYESSKGKRPLSQKEDGTEEEILLRRIESVFRIVNSRGSLLLKKNGISENGVGAEGSCF